MDINVLKEKSQELVGKVYENIGVIDNCEAVLKNMADARLSLLLNDGKAVGLDNVLEPKQQAEVMYSIRTLIKGNISETQSRLEKMIALIEPVPEAAEENKTAAIKECSEEKCLDKVLEEPPAEHLEEQLIEQNLAESSKSVKLPEPKRAYGKLKRETVVQLFKDGYTVEDIASKYGYKSTRTVMDFCKAQKIKVSVMAAGNDKAKKMTDEDIPTIKAIYTNGPMNLTDAAIELGTTKKILREFVEKHHLLKIAEKNKR